MALWTGILDPARATDWSGAGVIGGIPSTYTQSGSTIAAGASTATIQAALDACSGNKFVKLGVGAFSIGGLVISNDGCVLRGSGADQTFITTTSVAPTGCLTSYSFSIGICSGTDVKFNAAWTSGYTQGTTVITLASVTGLVVGQPIVLTQDDDASDGWPAAGDIFVCASTAGTPACSAQGGGDFAFNDVTSNDSGYKVIAINGTNVTISPGVQLPNYRAGQNPTAYWRNAATFIEGSGVEDLSIDFTSSGSGVNIHSTYGFNCWVKGVRSVFNGAAPSGTANFHVNWVRGINCTVRDNYLFGPTTGAGAILLYPLTTQDGMNLLWENNIVQREQAALVTNGPYSGSVFGYNFFPGRTGPGVVEHNSGDMMNLYEGNVFQGHYGDIDHGTHHMVTLFRNAMVGGRYNGGSTGTIQAMIHIQSKNRFFNSVGNVMGDSYINTYETTLADSSTSIYVLGWKGSASGSDPGNDTNVKRTLLRWGNWDSISNAVRWCGNSSNTGWSTTCASTTEVPSGITNFPNPIPATETLPPSFYLNAKPSWWPTAKAWPPIGPDVTGGNITNMAGHAYTNPAADCYFNVMGGPTNGGGSPLTFNAATCYPSSPADGGGGPPSGLPSTTRGGAITHVRRKERWR